MHTQTGKVSDLPFVLLKKKKEKKKEKRKEKTRFHGVGAAYKVLVLRTPVRIWVEPSF